MEMKLLNPTSTSSTSASTSTTSNYTPVLVFTPEYDTDEDVNGESGSKARQSNGGPTQTETCVDTEEGMAHTDLDASSSSMNAHLIDTRETDPLTPGGERGGWRTSGVEPSLSEAHRSIDVPEGKGCFRKFLAFLGPGYCIAVGVCPCHLLVVCVVCVVCAV